MDDAFIDRICGRAEYPVNAYPAWGGEVMSGIEQVSPMPDNNITGTCLSMSLFFLHPIYL